ncbi:agmatine deiminase family protein [Phocaeicola plebeius]|uniref:agmatine deiminase family protein n=1 Tax=Phocaeicola plebeius TaxID=310297 RepID=UPI00189A48F2|nr:agmatine deiminase family protein [Phocaeicola plebeius]
MIPDYGCNAVYFSEWLKKDYSDIYKGLARILNKHNVAYDIIPTTKDVWCRDYMPLQLDKERYLCYEYKPDYLMNSASNRKYITDSLNVCRDMQLNIKETPLIMDGGNVVKVGNKAIMTEKVFVENPSMDEDMLKKQLEKQMECEVVFIPWDRNEKYGHSDGIIKPISDNTILMTNYHDFDREYTNEVVKRLSSEFEIETLSYKVRKIAPESWAYINFLTVGKLIVLPALGIEEDEQALSQIKRYYPECLVEQLNISDLVKGGGGLNCVSWCSLVSDDERRYLTLYNRIGSEKELAQENMFTDEEIIFMCKHSLRRFADKFPGIAEYYMKCLDD